MLPVRELAEGRHEVSLAIPSAAAQGSPPHRYRIPFWK
jgi:hypothetical protein